MALSPDQSSDGRLGREWTKWEIPGREDASAGGSRLFGFRLRAFQLVAKIAATALLVIVVRNIWIGGRFPWADLANALLFLTLLFALRQRPDWLRPMSWLGLAGLLANAMEGYLPLGPHAVVPMHMLLPVLVLYGTLLGDFKLSMFAAIASLAIYATTIIGHWPLERRDTLIMSNLCLAILATGMASWGVGLQLGRLMANMNLQADDLRRELDARLRLNAILFHDIRNPLMVLKGATELALIAPDSEPIDLGQIGEQSSRIEKVIESARELEVNSRIPLSRVNIHSLWQELGDVFRNELASKQQDLVLRSDQASDVLTSVEVLCHSALGNILANAIKFSPRSSEIVMAAADEGEYVRVEIRDRGQGIPAEVLDRGSKGLAYKSHPGTEGESGSGYGLRIASLCVQRLQGWMELRNLADGGASVAMLLPRAGEDEQALAGQDEGTR